MRLSIPRHGLAIASLLSCAAPCSDGTWRQGQALEEGLRGPFMGPKGAGRPVCQHRGVSTAGESRTGGRAAGDVSCPVNDRERVPCPSWLGSRAAGAEALGAGPETPASE